MLPDGSRLHVAIPDITRAHWSVNVRKFVVRATHLDDLVFLDTLTGQAARFLEAAVASGLNILVSGGTQAGKITLLNCLAAAIPSRERVVTAEEVFELKVPLPDVVSMQCRQPSLEGTGETNYGGWSRRRCGCGRGASSSVRSARRRVWICRMLLAAASTVPLTEPGLARRAGPQRWTRLISPLVTSLVTGMVTGRSGRRWRQAN